METVELLQGITLDKAKLERRAIADQLAKKNVEGLPEQADADGIFKAKLEKQKKLDIQNLFREKEVDNL